MGPRLSELERPARRPSSPGSSKLGYLNATAGMASWPRRSKSPLQPEQAHLHLLILFKKGFCYLQFKIHQAGLTTSIQMRN